MCKQKKYKKIINNSVIKHSIMKAKDFDEEYNFYASLKTRKERLYAVKIIRMKNKGTPEEIINCEKCLEELGENKNLYFDVLFNEKQYVKRIKSRKIK